VGVVGLGWIIDDQGVAAATGQGAFDRRRESITSLGRLEFAFSGLLWIQPRAGNDPLVEKHLKQRADTAGEFCGPATSVDAVRTLLDAAQVRLRSSLWLWQRLGPRVKLHHPFSGFKL
jgi:hypothetical protein